jgi:hypothetical protein
MARQMHRQAEKEYDEGIEEEMGFRGTFVTRPTKPPHFLFRGAGRLLTQLRTGVCFKLGGWRYGAPPDVCPRCKEAVLVRGGGASVRHLFECPAAAALRIEHQGVTAGDLWAKPTRAVKYARAFMALADEDASQATEVGGEVEAPADASLA